MGKLQLSDIVNTLNKEKGERTETLPSKNIEEMNEKFEKIEKFKQKGFNFHNVDRFEREEIKRKVGKEKTKNRLEKWQPTKSHGSASQRMYWNWSALSSSIGTMSRRGIILKVYCGRSIRKCFEKFSKYLTNSICPNQYLLCSYRLQ